MQNLEAYDTLIREPASATFSDTPPTLRDSGIASYCDDEVSVELLEEPDTYVTSIPTCEPSPFATRLSATPSAEEYVVHSDDEQPTLSIPTMDIASPATVKCCSQLYSQRSQYYSPNSEFPQHVYAKHFQSSPSQWWDPREKVGRNAASTDASGNAWQRQPPCGLNAQRVDVVCRLRPLRRDEVQHEWIGWRIFDPHVVTNCETKSGRSTSTRANYRFDQVFGFSWSQSRLYNAIVEPRLRAALATEDSSYVLTTFGAPYSGRRYAKMGDHRDGMWCRAATYIFDAMHADTSMRFAIPRVSVTMVGLMSNKAVDLLGEAQRAGVDLRRDPEGGIGAERSTNAAAFLAFTAEDLMDILQVGIDMANRSGVPLLASCVTIHVEGIPRRKGARPTKCLATLSKICLLDVAVPVPGCVEGDPAMISSLCELFHAMRNNARYLPFRQSRLNTILSEVCVAQRATATFIAMIAAGASQFQESLVTLGFASSILRKRESQTPPKPVRLPEYPDVNWVDPVVEHSLMMADRLLPMCQRWVQALEPQAHEPKVSALLQQGQRILYSLQDLAIILSTGGLQVLSSEDLENALELMNKMIPSGAKIETPTDLVAEGSKLLEVLVSVVQRIDAAEQSNHDTHARV